MASQTPEALALGRQAQLGMLYDCCKDALIPGTNLWDDKTLAENIVIEPSPGTECHVIESDTIADKLTALRVPESMKASLLCGLVEARGAAKFLHDSKSSTRQARVTLQYSATTKVKRLNMTNLSYPSGCDPKTATHVVTGVQFGAQVFFVFDQEASPSEDMQEIQQDLQAMVNRMQRFPSDEGDGIAELTEKEKARAEKTACRIYGDISPEDCSVTYREAVNIYSALPKVLAEKAVPVRLWLHPLNLLGSKAVCHFHEISSELVCEIQNNLQQLAEKDKQCNDLAKNSAAATFPALKRKLQRFQGLCQRYKGNFQKRLSRTVPLIRRGEEVQDALVDILTNRQQSLFSFEQLGAFLDGKEKEMMFVNIYLDVLKGVEVVPTKDGLDRVLANPMLKCIVAFVFTSLEDEEPYLLELENSLSKKSPHHGSPSSSSEKFDSKSWFEHREIVKTARESAKAFLRFASLSSDDTKLIVSAFPDQEHPGVSIYLYEDGELVSTSLEPPSKPSPLVIGEISHDSIQLIFKPAVYGKAEISSYRVEYRIDGQKNWVAVNTKDKPETFVVTGLLPNNGYQFQYSAVGRLGLSECSDTTAIVTMLPIDSPGGLERIATECQASSLTGQAASLAGDDNNGQEYELEKVNERKLSEEATQLKQRGHEEGMKSVYRNDLPSASQEGAAVPPPPPASSLPVNDRVVDKMIKRSTVLEEHQPLTIYRLPLKKSATSSSSFIKYQLGHEDSQFPHKVIMVMGATGSGKTTLINGMINYILGVEWKDPFRFKLIHEETNRSQAQSQTSEVTAYEINHMNGFQIPYNLTIIDTPGFGDTRGIENDRLLTEKIREFFSTPGGIGHIDGVCFVVQGSLARLTQAQKYVFDSVLSIFGKDIKANIQILITFADGQLPPVLEAILESELPCAMDGDDKPVHFKFNNSALFASNSAANETSFDFDAMFWKMGAVSMKRFFTSLHHLEPRSLRMTKEVLQERKRLETAVQGLQPQIKAGLGALEALRKTRQTLEQHRDQMDANKNFVVEVERPVTVKIEVTDGFLTNCQTCHFTCHYPCAYDNDKDKHKCSSMDANGKCTVCPGKCVWNVHYNQKYRWEYKTVKEEQTFDQIKEKYRKACGEVMTAEKIFEQLSEEYECVENLVLELIEESSRSIERLQEIALKPSPMAAPEHIDLLIESEKQEAKPGFQDRIKALEGVKEMAVIVTKIGRGERLLPSEEKAAKKYNAKPFSCRKMFDYFTGWFSSKD